MRVADASLGAYPRAGETAKGHRYGGAFMKVAKILLAVSILALPLFVWMFWESIRGGEIDGLLLIGANLIAVCVFFVYSLDKP